MRLKLNNNKTMNLNGKLMNTKKQKKVKGCEGRPVSKILSIMTFYPIWYINTGKITSHSRRLMCHSFWSVAMTAGTLAEV